MSIHGQQDWLADLGAAWESAEAGTPQAGDLTIERFDGDAYLVTRSASPAFAELSWVRILERAKPASLRAVMASYLHDHEHERQVFIFNGDSAYEWESLDRVADADDLVDPVPLVELPSAEELRAVFLETPLGSQRYDKAYTDAVLELLWTRR